MGKNYFYQKNPQVFPTTDGKLIEEHFGKASTHHQHMSIAHMIAPPGWSEPHQKPDFDEWTLVSKGRKSIEVDGDQIIVEAGQSIMVNQGARVRYSNPFEEPCEYWSVCVPAFSMDTVHRED